MSSEEPGPLRTLALKLFRRLPVGPSQFIVRRVAPQYVIGAVVLIEHDGKLLTLKQLHRTGLSLPGGLVEPDEQPDRAAAREVFEETGLRVEVGDPVATVFDTRMRHCDVVYRVHCTARPNVEVASEARSFHWIDPENWPGEQDHPTERIMRAVKAAHRVPIEGHLLDEAHGSSDDDKSAGPASD